ncbi:MAG: hypothetical protein ACTSYM_01365 [Candidatus Baldrarchaeia archaeon]
MYHKATLVVESSFKLIVTEGLIIPLFRKKGVKDLKEIADIIEGFIKMTTSALNDLDNRLRNVEKIIEKFPIIESLQQRISSLETKIDDLEKKMAMPRAVSAPIPTATTPRLRPPIETVGPVKETSDFEKLKREMRKELEKLKALASLG